MCINIKNSKFKLHNHHKNLLITATLFVMMISLLPINVLPTRAASFSLDVAELVGNENSLRSAINRAGGPAIIAINADIQLSTPLTIATGKDITLTSNGDTKLW